MTERRVYITRTAAFLPGPPVANDQIEARLGLAGGLPSRARALVLRNNGIRLRHYAVDAASGTSTLSNAQMTAEAVRRLTGDDFTPDRIECLATGTSIADQLMPSHAVMVHGELGIPPCEVAATSGICASGAAALKYAWMSVLTGGARHAVATGSELASPLLHAHNFAQAAEASVDALAQQPVLAFEMDFLRWMLSDGAGAVLLQNTPAPRGLSLAVEWIDLCSYANELPACMYAGARKDAAGKLRGWAQYTPEARLRESLFSIRQDVRLLDAHIVSHALRQPLERLIARRGLRAGDFDWFLPHMSSEYFRQPIANCLAALDFAIPQARWYTNLATRGNTGSAAFFIMLDELCRSGQIRDGQRLLGFIPESGRFSSAFIGLRAHVGPS